MSRKRTNPSLTDEPSFKRTKASNSQGADESAWKPPNANTSANNLLSAITQYPVFEHVLAHLRWTDLVSLAQTCQSAHSILKLDELPSRVNLRKKALCPGYGIRLREGSHLVPPPGSFHYHNKCGGDDDGEGIESHPCTQCGVNTCNECRIHVTYQSLIGDPGVDGKRWWAGNVFLFQPTVRLFPPRPTKEFTQDEIDVIWSAPSTVSAPQHDQGRIGVAFDSLGFAKPEPLDQILDQDLGSRIALKPKGIETGVLDPSTIMVPFDMKVRNRAQPLCDECFNDLDIKRCNCTLRRRFLDRWLCLLCYWEENHADESLGGVPFEGLHQCGCGKVVDCTNELDLNLVCNWCKGKIVLREDESDDEEVDEDDPSNHVTIIADGPLQQLLSESVSRSLMLKVLSQEGDLDLNDEDSVS